MWQLTLNPNQQELQYLGLTQKPEFGAEGFPVAGTLYVHPFHPPDSLCIWCYYPHFTNKDTEAREG